MRRREGGTRHLKAGGYISSVLLFPFVTRVFLREVMAREKQSKKRI